jgi:NADH:ubiquinone oxidoreductase subunit 6 (subunit J)
MMKNNIFINLVYSFIVLSSIFVIVSSNAIYALFFLVLSFIFSSILLISLECEFLALLIIIIYVGAISVLFLFLIMMVDFKMKNSYKHSAIYLFSGIFYLLLIYFLMLDHLIINFKSCYDNKYYTLNYYINWVNLQNSIYEVESYSLILYSFFVLQFLLIGFILLVVLIGAVYFINFHVKTNKSQITVKQIACTF